MIKASEEATIYYAFDDDVLREYKKWIDENHMIISKDTFYEYIINNYNMSMFEEDTGYSCSLDFEEDLEEKIKSLND